MKKEVMIKMREVGRGTIGESRIKKKVKGALLGRNQKTKTKSGEIEEAQKGER